MNRRYYIWGCVTGFLIALLGVAAAGYFYLQPPDVALRTLQLKDLQGQAINAESFVGKPMVVNFWATWCGPCLKELPDMLHARDQLQGRVNFIFVSDEGADKIIPYLMKKNFSGNFLCNRFPLDSIGLRVRPTTFFYDEKGNLVDKHPGPVDYQMLMNKYGR